MTFPAEKACPIDAAHPRNADTATNKIWVCTGTGLLNAGDNLMSGRDGIMQWRQFAGSNVQIRAADATGFDA
ncbi:hypothetical protein GCM10011586_28000 [Silvibacterium dinghuense]|nr:hypothetical protein GCM10011586_28000 [Silvibacterium dinghuense]